MPSPDHSLKTATGSESGGREALWQANARVATATHKSRRRSGMVPPEHSNGLTLREYEYSAIPLKTRKEERGAASRAPRPGTRFPYPSSVSL